MGDVALTRSVWRETSGTALPGRDGGGPSFEGEKALLTSKRAVTIFVIAEKHGGGGNASQKMKNHSCAIEL